MGQRHVRVIESLGLDLVGLHDRNADALADAGRALSIPSKRLCSRVDQLLEQRPDCVIVATTAPSHADLTCAAAEAGARYVLCEKPMATSLDDCDRMIRVCREHSAGLAINHPMRFTGLYAEPKRLLESAEHGGLCSMLVVAGNFGLAMNATHYFDAFRFVSGEPPESVSAWFSEERVANPRGPEFEDRAGEVRMTSTGGKRFYLNASADQGYGIRSVYASRYGQIEVDELSGRITSMAREEKDRALSSARYATAPVSWSADIPPVDAVAAARTVLEALLSGNNPPTGEDGRLVIETLVAAYVSAEQDGATVRVDDPSLPRDRVFPWA